MYTLASEAYFEVNVNKTHFLWKSGLWNSLIILLKKKDQFYGINVSYLWIYMPLFYSNIASPLKYHLDNGSNN